MKTTAYLRCSTTEQDEQSQREIIAGWTAAENTQVNEWATDRASGATPWQQRGIAAVLATAAKGDTIIVSEVSRIARSVTGVLSFLEAARLADVRVIACRNRLILDDSLPAKITVTVLALAAEIERDLIRERTRAALAARRAAGATLGRPVGSRSASKCKPHALDIARMLNARVSQRAIARLINVSPSTLAAFLKDNPPDNRITTP